MESQGMDQSLSSQNKNIQDNMNMSETITTKYLDNFTDNNVEERSVSMKDLQKMCNGRCCNMKHYFEYTYHKSKVKPFYDLDISLSKDTTQEERKEKTEQLKQSAIELLSKYYPEGELAIASSHGMKKTIKTKNKVKQQIEVYAISFHILVNGYEASVKDVKEFNLKHNLYGQLEGLDKAVYRDGGNMRMLYSTKPNDKRVKIPETHKHNIYKHIIQSNKTTNHDFKPLVDFEPKKKSPPVSPVSTDEEKDEEVPDNWGNIQTYDLNELNHIINDIAVEIYYGNYEDWIKVGMALHNITGGDDMGLCLYKRFSKKYENYSEEELIEKWQSFNNGSGNKVGITTLRKYRDNLMPEENLSLQDIFKKTTQYDKKNTKAGCEAILQEMNKRLIFVKETGDYVLLDKKLISKEDGSQNYMPCWYLKNTAKTRDHFAKENFVYVYEDDGELKKEKINPFKMWCEWIGRKEVRAIGFDPANKDNPDIFNLWNGFRIDKKTANEYNEEEAEPILKHIKELWCRNDLNAYEYILNLFAHYIQKPHIKSGVLLALRSKQGGGKGIILDKLAKIIGDQHYAQNSNAKHLFGDFNGQLEGKIVVNLDEAFWGGDKSLEGVIKNKITEKRQTINKKNKEAYMIDCYANYIITTNNDWFAGTTEDDRRHYCLELDNRISGRMNKNTEKEVKPVLDAPPEAFAKILYNRDISDFNPRIFKKTKLLQEQVERNHNSVKVWYRSILQAGGFSDFRVKNKYFDWGTIPTKDSSWNGTKMGCKTIKNKKGDKVIAYEKDFIYEIYNQISADGRKFSKEAFYREFKKNCLDDLYKEIRPRTKSGARPTYLILPSLKEARDKWNELQEYDYEYDEGDEWEECTDDESDEEY